MPIVVLLKASFGVAWFPTNGALNDIVVAVFQPLLLVFVACFGAFQLGGKKMWLESLQFFNQQAQDMYHQHSNREDSLHIGSTSASREEGVTYQAVHAIAGSVS